MNIDPTSLRKLAATAACCLLLILGLTGCAHSTIESRKAERYSAYAGLADESRQLVDTGKIKVGMSMDAVYIAWGKPSQVIHSETPEGAITTWLYEDTHLESYRYWTYQTYYSRRRTYSYPYLAHDYHTRNYISAEVIFQNDQVLEWRTFPHPVGY